MKKDFYNILLLLAFIALPYSCYAISTHPNQLTVEPLFWKLHAGSSENWAQKISPAGNVRNTQVLKAPFHFDKGFRISTGYHSLNPHWDLIGQWTWFHTSALSAVSDNNGGIYSSYIGNFFANNTNGAHFGPNYRQANLHWKTGINIANIELGRTVHQSHVTLRPYVGIVFANINHQIKTLWQNPNPFTFFNIPIPQNFSTASETLRNHFWGIGPSLGVNTTWQLYQTANTQFNLVGNFGGSVMTGHWKFKENYQNNNGTNIDVQVKPVTSAATMIKGLIGVEWKKQCQHTNLSISLGYESQVWFDQMQFYSFNMGRLNNLLSLQGLTLGIGVQF